MRWSVNVCISESEVQPKSRPKREKKQIKGLLCLPSQLWPQTNQGNLRLIKSHQQELNHIWPVSVKHEKDAERWRSRLNTWNSFHSPEHLSRTFPHYQKSIGFVLWCSFLWTWHLVCLHLLAPLSRFNQGKHRNALVRGDHYCCFQRSRNVGESGAHLPPEGLETRVQLRAAAKLT